MPPRRAGTIVGMAAKDDLGRAGEDRAALHLTAAGMRVVDRNWRCPGGEIDIVALDGPDLVIVEVKTRTSLAFGDPLSAVDDRKHARLWRLGVAWSKTHSDMARGRSLRIDLVAVTGPVAALADVSHLRDLR
jgi:putative endonuclease